MAVEYGTRPSNGTMGDLMRAQLCNRCTVDHDGGWHEAGAEGGESCPIIFDALVGEHSFRDEGIVVRLLHGFYDPTLIIIEGGAKGADAIASFWAQTRPEGVGHETYPPDWAAHGKAAGPIRNQRMLDDGKPDLVLAFVDKPLAESNGTADMVRRARAAGVTTYVVEATHGP